MRQVPKIYAFFVFFLLIFTPLSFAACKLTPSTLVNGQKVAYGTIDVLNLHGSYCEMGQQYGTLESGKLQQFYHRFYLWMKAQHSTDLPQIQQIAQQLYDNYPQRFKNLFLGMAQTSGLSLKQHIFLNAFEHIMYYNHLTDQPGCSAIAAWGKNSINSQLIVGRNYDYFVGHPEFKKMLSITVFHPADGANSTAIITFLGTLNATTNVNEQGLYLELNNGYPSAKLLSRDSKHYANRMDTTIDLLSMMLDASTLKDLDTQIHSLKSTASYIINIANKHEAVSYEWTDQHVVRVNTNPSDLLISTNHFLDPTWNIQQQDNLWDTLQRYDNLQELAQLYKNQFSVETMKKLLEKPFDTAGGATTNKTIYQVIVDPATQMCWIRLPQFADKWQGINLRTYFLS